MKKLLLALALLMTPGLIRAQQLATNYVLFAYDSGTSTPSYCTPPAWFVNTTAPQALLYCGTSHAFVNITATSGVVLTAPVINNPVISGPVPVPCGATCSATTGQLILMNQAAGSAVTIPAATGTGNVIRMRVTVATTSAQDKVLLTTVTDTIIGTAVGQNAGTAKVFPGNAGTFHSIQMPFAGSQPSGGFIGDSVTCTDIASTIWACDIAYQAGTTPTTPYNAGTT